MVHFLAISIFLLPVVTAPSEDFWGDVDMADNDLSDPEVLSTQATTSQVQPVEPLPEIPQHSPPTNKNDNNTLKRRAPPSGHFFPKFVTLRMVDIEEFKEKLITSDSQNLSLTTDLIIDKIDALGNTHEWIEIHTYEVDKYRKYWAKVCVTFWNKPLVRGHRLACLVSRSYATNKKRILQIGQRRLNFDLLACKCHTYTTNCRKPLSTPETFLIHKSNENEFFIFEENESGGKQLIKGFKDGVTLPNPSVSERSTKSSAKYMAKLITLRPFQINMFNREITIDNSYPQNLSLEELNAKLMEFEDIHEWPDLFKYDYEMYSRYWAQVCVFFWGKPLDTSHRQACYISPSVAENSVRTIFLPDKKLHFDLLLCKCHSYTTTVKIPVSSPDTFLIHQSSENEFFVFDQHATELCKYTLFIKDFKGGITLPNPENFNWTIVS